MVEAIEKMRAPEELVANVYHNQMAFAEGFRLGRECAVKEVLKLIDDIAYGEDEGAAWTTKRTWNTELAEKVCELPRLTRGSV